MKIGREDYPIYLNPTDSELQELVIADSWDTLRFLEDEPNIAVASGYGNDHSTIARAIRAIPEHKRFHGTAYILFHTHRKLFFNLEDINGKAQVPWRNALRYFPPMMQKLVKEIAAWYDPEN